MGIRHLLLAVCLTCSACGSESSEVAPSSGSGSTSSASSSGDASSSSGGEAETTGGTGDQACGNGSVEGSEACDDMNEDALDGCLSDCSAGPTAIVRSPGRGLDYQGAGGGVRFDDVCPDGEVMIGLRGQWQSAVERIQVVCGRIDVTESGGQWTVGVGEATVLPERGSSSGTPFEAICPPGHAVVGFSGRAADKLDAVGLSCAPLGVVVLEGESTLSLNLSDGTEIPIVGAPSGADFGPSSCDTGEAVTSALIRTEDNVNGLGLSCSALGFG